MPNYRLTICATLLLTAIGASSSSTAQDRTFGGYDCTDDCSGHAAGYQWAEVQGLTDPADCPPGNSQSFYQGCLAYTDDPYRGSDANDDGGGID
jgi:hypothetical protein